MNSSNLNSVYSLGKDKKTGKWSVGKWVNQALWCIDGTNKRICAYKDMTHWRFFRESRSFISDVQLTPGVDRVSVEKRAGVNEWFYVIDAIRSEDGKFHYLVGI